MFQQPLVIHFFRWICLFFLLLIIADPPRKRIDSLKLTLNGSSRLSLGNLSEGSPLSGRRGLAVQKL